MLVFTNLYAQEKKPGILKEAEVSDAIDRGIVVAFGEKIESPYYIAWDNGKVLINGIVFLPREKDPSEKPKDIQVTDLDIQKHNLIKDCEKSYVDYYTLYGENQAREKILEEYGKHPLISSLVFDGDRLQIEFNDGDHICIMMNTFIMANEGAYPTDEEIKTQRMQNVDRLKSLLQQGWMISFGYEYTLYIPKKEAEKIDGIAIDVKNGKLSHTKGKQEIMQIIRKSKVAEDILKRVSSWK